MLASVAIRNPKKATAAAIRWKVSSQRVGLNQSAMAWSSVIGSSPRFGEG